ncbi:hypothetical protein NC651_032445 [Populus alba x Populus x berolinensis]|nr:hypothetical protein NC651_032445 [Populus alba x Populus x berolinensis]
MRSDLKKRSFMKEESINWHGNDQNPPRWEDLSCKFLVTTLKVDKPENGLSSESSLLEGDMFIALIATGHSESVPLPEIPEGMACIAWLIQLFHSQGSSQMVVNLSFSSLVK